MIDVVYFRSRYQEIILAILNRISCVLYEEEFEMEDFESLEDIPLSINDKNPVKRYAALAKAKSNEPAYEFFQHDGDKIMSELKANFDEFYYTDPPRSHDCAVDVAIDYARLETFLEFFDHRGSYLEPDAQILKDWLKINPTEIGRENWS